MKNMVGNTLLELSNIHTKSIGLMTTTLPPPTGLPMTREEFFAKSLEERNDQIDKWVDEGNNIRHIGFASGVLGLTCIVLGFPTILLVLVGFIAWMYGTFAITWGAMWSGLWQFYGEDCII